MGFLTTFTIYNDTCDQLNNISPEDAVDFCRNLYLGCIGALHRNSGDKHKSSASFGLGYHANFCTVQRSRHADDRCLYLHCGNTLTDLSIYGHIGNLLESGRIKGAEEIIAVAEELIKAPKLKIKESKD